MNKQYNDMRAEIAVLEEMARKTKSHERRLQLQSKIKIKKREAHAYLFSLQQESAQKKKQENEKKHKENEAMFTQVAHELLPSRLFYFINTEMQVRANDGKPNRYGPLTWLAVLLGLRKCST